MCEKCSVDLRNAVIRSKNRRCTQSKSDAAVISVNYVKHINLPVIYNKLSSQMSVKQHLLAIEIIRARGIYSSPYIIGCLAN